MKIRKRQQSLRQAVMYAAGQPKKKPKEPEPEGEPVSKEELEATLKERVALEALRQQRGARKVQRRSSGWPTGPTSRVRRAGHATHWVSQANQRREMLKLLRKIPTISCIQECSALKYVTAEFPNMWALANAPQDSIRTIPGLGAKRRQAIHDYLVAKNVPVTWEV